MGGRRTGETEDFSQAVVLCVGSQVGLPAALSPVRGDSADGTMAWAGGAHATAHTARTIAIGIVSRAIGIPHGHFRVPVLLVHWLARPLQGARPPYDRVKTRGPRHNSDPATERVSTSFVCFFVKGFTNTLSLGFLRTNEHEICPDSANDRTFGVT